MATTGVVRYSSDTDNNARIRSALAQVDGYRCYVCTEPKAFRDLQIDHLIPRTIPNSDFEELKKVVRVPVGFHLDGPENLAVICGPCNGMKSDNVVAHKPLFQIHIDRAIHRAQKVTDVVLSLVNGRALSRALVLVSQANIDDDSTREDLRLFAPGVVQRLASVDENLIDYVQSETLREQRSTELPEVRLMVNNRLRFLRDLLQLLADVKLSDVVESMAGETATAVIDACERALAAGPMSEYDYDFSIGSPDVFHLEITVNDAEVVRSGGELNVAFEGVVDAWISAHVLGDDPDQPSHLRDSQTDVWIFGAFHSNVQIPLDAEEGHSQDDFIVDVSKVEFAVDWSS